MNSHIAEPLSAPVRSRPLLSIEEIRGEKNCPPPSPLQGEVFDPVPIEVRRKRVANGSRRKRDLIAVQEADAQELHDLVAAVPENSEAFEVWEAARERIRVSVPESTFHLWIEPLQALAVTGTTLILSAPRDRIDWAERRYASLIAEALADGSEFCSVQFVVGDEGQ